ncbi:MAG: TIGR04133 family radical SAM/SPASM protein [Treponema sp.]|jgi:radical SAM enzyme (rSAM/lipoprotein system)|nr:TIGR04133 family radical SAM/SPASM protein [Treponema sp.]
MRNKFLQFISRRFKKNETALHELMYLFWECTRRCNLKCLHCGSDCTADCEIPDMPFDDFLKAILPLKEMYKPNTITVAITGGEPILRKDLPECGKKLRENGFRWGIVTNGYDYTPDIHDRLLGAGMGSLTLSLDGLEPSHNWLRANNKSFTRAVKALDLITASTRLNYDVVTCVNQKNIDELEKLRKFLISRNVKAWRLFTIAPIGRAADNEILQLTPPQLKQLMEFIVRSRADKRMAVTFSCEAWLGDYELAARDTYFFCRAGIQIASVLTDGSISACPNINRDFVQGNIYRDNFADVWNNRFEIMRDRRWTKTGICLDCKDYKNCLGGAMHLWNGKKDGIMTCINQKIESVR